MSDHSKTNLFPAFILLIKDINVGIPFFISDLEFFVNPSDKMSVDLIIAHNICDVSDVITTHKISIADKTRLCKKICYIVHVTPAITNQEAIPLDATVAKFLPYLAEIQKKLVTLAATVLLSGVFGFVYYQKILTFVLHFFNLKGITVVLTSPYQFLDLAVNTGLTLGFVVAFPLLLYFLVGFLRPALAPKEFKLLIRLIPLSLILFVVGFAFGVWIMQFVITIYSQTTAGFNVGNLWDISHFFAQIMIMGLCLGIVFELPIILTLLMRFKVIKKQLLSMNRRLVYASAIVFAAVLPPNDVISLSILFIVPILLFEITLLFNQ